MDLTAIFENQLFRIDMLDHDFFQNVIRDLKIILHILRNTIMKTKPAPNDEE